MNNDKIVAAIVTYNRLDFLKELIEALRSQTRIVDKIIVTNNGSSDGTTEWLAKQDDIQIINQSNTGSSGGQYTGFKAAYDTGYDWIWIMDDDVIPKPDCLEVLMKGISKNDVHAPLRYTPEGEPFFNDAISYNFRNPFRSIWEDIYSSNDLENEYTDAVGITFEGPIFHRSLIDKIGLPEKKFFIYGDDTEYFIRAFKSGVRISVVRDAKFDRKLSYADPLAGFGWKHYYIIRNIIAIDVLNAPLLVRLIRPFGYLIKWLVRSKNISDIKTTFKAFFDGYFYRSEN